MIIKIKGFGEQIYIKTAQDLMVLFVKLSVPVSLFGWWKLYELAKPYLEG